MNKIGEARVFADEPALALVFYLPLDGLVKERCDELARRDLMKVLRTIIGYRGGESRHYLVSAEPFVRYQDDGARFRVIIDGIEELCIDSESVSNVEGRLEATFGQSVDEP
jgi:hypothetical protein